MKKILFSLLFLLLFSVNYAQEKESDAEIVTTYYLIRHAEKEKDKNNPTDRNPNISKTGIQRAKNWAKVLKNVTLDAVYSTNYNRTKQTAKPIAISRKLETIIYDLKTFNLEKFKLETKGKTVVIVGHSNTIPKFVNELIGSKKYQQIKESNYSNLYIVTIIGNAVSSKLLSIN